MKNLIPNGGIPRSTLLVMAVAIVFNNKINTR
jgi:hypothetical protein